MKLLCSAILSYVPLSRMITILLIHLFFFSLSLVQFLKSIVKDISEIIIYLKQLYNYQIFILVEVV